jgi:hypothetical protein
MTGRELRFSGPYQLFMLALCIFALSGLANDALLHTRCARAG